jgi:DNA-binding response OmpR family regulator
MRVLLVDDEKKFVSVLAKRLKMRGFDVDHAFTGRDAIDMASKSTYDVMALDVKMPGMGGIELKEKLAKLNPDAHFIFVTGHGSLEDFTVGSSEASAYLSKPVDIGDLIDAIRRCAGSPPSDGGPST